MVAAVALFVLVLSSRGSDPNQNSTVQIPDVIEPATASFERRWKKAWRQ